MAALPKPAAQKTASALQVARAVFWSFLGIRRGMAHQSDALKLKPVQVVVAGIIGAAILVSGLLLLVKFVISRAV